MQKRDFSKRRSFPGTHNNDFDIFLRVMSGIKQLPAPVFAGLLVILALAASFFEWDRTIGLLLFMLGDWLLIRLLPVFEKSYGPAAPATLALAIPRALVWLLPSQFAVPLQAAGTLLVVYGFYVEPARLTVTHQSLKSPKLRKGSPIRVLHLGDLHVERVTDRERKLVARVKALSPDLILFSGDFLNLSFLRDPEAQAACRWVLGQLCAPSGTYAVTGSPAVDSDDTVARLLDGLPWRWLRDEKVSIDNAGQRLDLVGLACSHKPFVDGPKLRSVLAGTQPLAESLGTSAPLPAFTILLYHSPDLAPEAAEAGIDLQLSGHTHGGQVRLPFFGALFTASLYGKAFEAGRRQLGGLTLYVTRGLGMEGAGAPRVRCLCPPEIILWEIDGL